MKKQGKVKPLKIDELNGCGSAVRTKKMLKMQDDPAMCMKPQCLATEWRLRNDTFLIELESVLTTLWTLLERCGRNQWWRKASTELSPPVSPRHSAAN